LRTLAGLRLLAAAGAAAAVAGGAPATGGALGASGRCPPRGAHVLGEDGAIGVYEHGGTGLFTSALYGCLKPDGTRVTLARHRGPGLFDVGPVAVAGAWTSFAESVFGIDSGCTSIVVARVQPRPLLRPAREAGCTVDAGIISSARVTDLVVSPRGATAWIVSTSQRPPGGGPQTAAVEVVEAKGSAPAFVLDPGPAVQTGSLRLARGVLSWRDRGGSRTASLP
jgi:hypothetical protein